MDTQANELIARWRPTLSAHAREIADLTALLEPEIGWYWQPIAGVRAQGATGAGAATPPAGAPVEVIRIIRSDNRGIQVAARLVVHPGTASAGAGSALWLDRFDVEIDDIAAYLERYKPAPPPPPGLIQLQMGPPGGLPFVPPAFRGAPGGVGTRRPGQRDDPGGTPSR